MAILLNKDSKVLVQGMTGKEGSRATKEMLDYGTNVVCGVTPKKGGQEVEGKPIFNSVAEAVEKFPDINVSVLYVPPLAAKYAAVDAIKAGIKLIVIIAETIPIHDVAYMIKLAEKNNVRIIGPSSIGVMSSGIAKVGSIGGDSNIQYTKGPVGIISKSGGMSSETAMMLKQAGFGTSTVIGIGGDVIMGSDFSDMLALFEKDPETKVIVMFCEIGGLYEQKAAEFIKKEISKPVIAFVSGKFAENMPRVSLGHAGAILEGKGSSRDEKIAALEDAGVKIAHVHHEIVDLVKEVLE